MPHLIQTSFNAGELTPLLDARSSVEKYASGCRRLKNMMVSVHGPAVKRPGMEHLGYAETNAIPPRLIGLNFSSTTSFVVEVTSGKFRFWSNGVLVPFTLVHPYSDSDIYDIQTAQVNDVIYLVHPNYVPRILERYGDLDWRLREIHQPKTGWTDPGNTTPATGDAVIERWFPAPFQCPSLASAVAFTKANAPQQIVPNSGSPFGTGNNWPASISRLRGWFVAPSNGDYIFRAAGTDDQAQVMFNSTAYGPASGAVAIITANTPGANTDSAAFTLVAGSAYYIEFLLNDVARPALGGFQYFIGGVLQGYCVAQLLAANLNGKGGTTLDGWPALLDENITATTIAAAATTGATTLTASADTFLPSHVGAWWQISHRREGAYVEIVSAASTAAATQTAGMRVVGKYTVYTYGTWTGILYLEELQPDGTTWSVIRTWRSVSDRNVIDTGTAEVEAILRLRVSDIVWTGPAAPRFLLEASDSKVYGLARITGYTSPTVVDATIYGSLFSTAATPYWTEGAWSAHQGYPRTVCLHQQRTNWGGTTKRPQSIWGSVTGDFENFRRSTFDDGSYLYQVASENSFLIQWMLSQGDLMIGTSLDEWVATAPQEAPITPLNLAFRRQSANGSDYRQAIPIRETVVFAQRNSMALSRLVYRDTGKYGASDISVLASHLFTSGVRQMAWQAQPSNILWMVQQSGKLVGLTYEEDQNVFACHEHNTAGLIKSVAVVHGPQGDEVWLCVDRGTVASPSYRIERLEPRTLFAGGYGATSARRCYVDGAVLREAATAFDTVTGLGHLEGKTVSIFADGSQRPAQVVAGGEITLDVPATVACVGLGYMSEVQPMKLEVQLQDGTAQGRKFKVNRVVLRLLDSLGGSVADYPGAPKEVIQYREVGMLMDAPPPIFSGDKEVVLQAHHRPSADLIITHDEPLPFTLCAATVIVDIYGD